MKTSPRGIELIKRFEGLALQVYSDAAGYKTIGYGHVLQAGEDAIFANGITEADAEDLLVADLAHAERTVSRNARSDLNQNQFDALVSLCFNIGSRRFKTSTVLRLANARAGLDVPLALLQWRKSGGVILKGLVRRRLEEGLLYLAD